VATKSYGNNDDKNDDNSNCNTKNVLIIMEKRRRKRNCIIEGYHETYNRWNRNYYTNLFGNSSVSSFLLLLLLQLLFIPLLLSLLSVEAFVFFPHKSHNHNNNYNHQYHHQYQDLQTQRHYYQSNSNSNSNNRPVNCRRQQQRGQGRQQQLFPTSHSFASLSSHNRRDFLSQGGIGTSTSTVLYFWPGRNDNYNDRPLSRYVDTVDQNYTLAETSEDYIDLRDGQRLVCVGDVHGDLWALQDFLELAGVYDRSKDIWVGGDTIVVQCGDVLDRGMEELACYELLSKLSHQAPLSGVNGGGKVILLIGNHEAMNALGQFQYVYENDNLNDGSGSGSSSSNSEHEHKIGIAVDDELQTPNWRIQYANNSPCRWACYEPGGLLSISLLSNMKVAVRVGKTVCVHAGLRPSHLKDYGGIEGMNQLFRDWITLGYNNNKNNNNNTYTTDSDCYDCSDHNHQNQNYNDNPVRYNHRGKYKDPRQPYLDAEKRQNYYRESMPNFLKGGSSSSSIVGPIWMRDYSSPHDHQPNDPTGKIQTMIDETLLLLDCDRMVMGHTIQQQINSVLNDKAWRIDVGASRGCASGHPEVLEIIANNSNKNNDNCDNIDSIDTVSILTKGGGIQGRVVTKIPASERSVGGSGGDIGMAATATTTAAAAESGGFFLNI